MSRRNRRLGFGSAAALILGGFLAIVLADGVTGDVAGFVALAVGLIAAIALGFLEVGLSEERAREAERRH